MKTIEVLSAAEIKDGMTKGVWVETPNVPLTINKGMVDIWSVSRNGVEHNSIANAAAITTAVNATYNAGYDPVMVDKMYKMLWGLAHEAKLHKHEQLAIHELLKQCKI
jgi:hypothetical protein